MQAPTAECLAELRRLPAVHLLADSPAAEAACESFGREAVVEAARRVLETARRDVLAGAAAPPSEELAARLTALLMAPPLPFRAVLNATGVVLHTNLGRAPLPEAAWEAMAAARGACDLELDLLQGERASRLRDVGPVLQAVTGAADGLVVNNNAAAVLLALAALAGKRPTAVSRGHLVEIGGGFRLPDILEASGSPLHEVGTTNRTHLDDYAAALDAGAAVVLLVHRSNFVQLGYVHDPEPAEVVQLCQARGVPVVLDLGGGALLAPGGVPLDGEPSVQSAVRAGLELVCFSGDKLVGGPQAGYIAGAAAAVERCRRHPLARALRCDKLQLAGCLATLELYRLGLAAQQVPVWSMLTGDTTARAAAWAEALAASGAAIEVVSAAGAVGGGSAPAQALPGSAVAIGGREPMALAAALRRGEPPVLATIERGRVLLHPRAVSPQDDARLLLAVRRALAEAPA